MGTRIVTLAGAIIVPLAILITLAGFLATVVRALLLLRQRLNKRSEAAEDDSGAAEADAPVIYQVTDHWFGPHGHWWQNWT